MRYIDFLFYSYYCHCERRNKRFPKLFGGNSRFFAFYLFTLTLGGLIGFCYLLIDEYIIHLPMIPKLGSSAESLIGLVACCAILGPFIYRYFYDKNIIKGDYKIFKERWGEDPRIHKRGRIAVLVYTILSMFLPFCVAIILHEINN